MTLEEILVGLPEIREWKGKTYETAIFKKKINSPSAQVNFLNIVGDKQADPRFHGGEHKAVYGYDFSFYPQWNKILQREVELGSFGENLCISSLDEKSIYIGDVFEIGTTQLQAVQPRLPCQKLAVRTNDQTILKTFLNTGKPGVYFKVIKEGILSKGDKVKLIQKSAEKVSVFELFEIYAKKKLSHSRKKELLESSVLIDDWLEIIKRIETKT